MKQTWIILSIIGVTFLMLFGVVLYAITGSTTADVEPSANAKAFIGERTHDWGAISMADGNAEAVFQIKNEGTDILTLFNPVTSCTCTTVQLIKGEEKSAQFGMHTKSRYVMEVQPGETVDVKAVFDPAFHGPGGVGDITRQVTIETNDANNPSVTFNMRASVTK